MNWNLYFIKMAHLVASKSKDKSTNVGAVIVGPDNEIRSTGYNNFPRGINDDVEERHGRPQKYEWTEHAERNAIYNAARIGVPVKGCTMYFNYEPSPCADCARGIIQSGINKIVGPNIPFPGKGRGTHYDQCETNISMLIESGVFIVTVDNITEKDIKG